MTFDELYTLYYKKSVVLVMHYVHDTIISEDIVSDVMIKLWHEIQKGKVNCLSALLFSMLRNKALNELKHQKIVLETCTKNNNLLREELNYRISLFSDLPDYVKLNEINRLTKYALSKLPKDTQRIFHLSRVKMLKNREIASILNISVKTVEYHISKALRVLRIELKDYYIIALILIYLNQ